MFTLTNNTTGTSWEYDSEAQLKTVTMLQMRSNPRSSYSVTIDGKTTCLR